jgi:hypothetical protein
MSDPQEPGTEANEIKNHICKIKDRPRHTKLVESISYKTNFYVGLWHCRVGGCGDQFSNQMKLGEHTRLIHGLCNHHQVYCLFKCDLEHPDDRNSQIKHIKVCPMISEHGRKIYEVLEIMAPNDG